MSAPRDDPSAGPTVYVVGVTSADGAIRPRSAMPYAVRQIESAREALSTVLKRHASGDDDARMNEAIAAVEGLRADGGAAGPFDGDWTLWISAMTVTQLAAVANSEAITTAPADPGIGAMRVDDACDAFNRWLDSLEHDEARTIAKYFSCQARQTQQQVGWARCCCPIPGFCQLTVQRVKDLAPAE